MTAASFSSVTMIGHHDRVDRARRVRRPSPSPCTRRPSSQSPGTPPSSVNPWPSFLSNPLKWIQNIPPSVGAHRSSVDQQIIVGVTRLIEPLANDNRILLVLLHRPHRRPTGHQQCSGPGPGTPAPCSQDPLPSPRRHPSYPMAVSSNYVRSIHRPVPVTVVGAVIVGHHRRADVSSSRQHPACRVAESLAPSITQPSLQRLRNA